MIPRDFCNWLKGYLDGTEDGDIHTLKEARLAIWARLKDVKFDAPAYYSPYHTGQWWHGGTVLTNNTDQLQQVAGTTASYVGDLTKGHGHT